jgi:hypothetical protein
VGDDPAANYRGAGFYPVSRAKKLFWKFRFMPGLSVSPPGRDFYYLGP